MLKEKLVDEFCSLETPSLSRLLLGVGISNFSLDCLLLQNGPTWFASPSGSMSRAWGVGIRINAVNKQREE